MIITLTVAVLTHHFCVMMPQLLFWCILLVIVAVSVDLLSNTNRQVVSNMLSHSILSVDYQLITAQHGLPSAMTRREHC
jgi:hypothetical protein